MNHHYASHQPNIDPRFLDPNSSFVVMVESDELDLDGLRLALDGIAHLCQSAADMNAKLRSSGNTGKYIEVPADSLAALMRVMANQIKPMATNNPTLSSVLAARPDLCGGV